MTFSSWLRSWNNGPARKSPRNSRLRTKKKGRSATRLLLEQLEERSLLSASPFVQSISPTASSFTDPDSIRYNVTFSEAVTGVDITDFQFVRTSPAPGFITTNLFVGNKELTGTGSTYTVTLSKILGFGDLSVNLVDDGTIHDSLGNKLVPSPNGLPQTVQTFSVTDGRPGIFRYVAATVADIGNGSADIVSIAQQLPGSMYLSILQGDGHGTFQPPRFYGPVSHSAPTPEIVMADLNGDTYPDIVMSSVSGGAEVMLNNGDGTFANRVSIGGAPSESELLPKIAVSDLNGDTYPDIILGADLAVSVNWGNGDGTFQEERLDLPGASYCVAVADLGNGSPDIVVGGRNGTVGVLIGNGDGTFQVPTFIPVGDIVSSVAVANLGNGKAGIVAVTNDHVSVVPVDSKGNLGTPTSYAIASGDNVSNQTVVRMADVDGDGTLDIVAALPDGSVRVLTGNSNGTFNPEKILPLLDAHASMVVADVDGDGKPDIVLGDSYDDNVTVLTRSNNGNFLGQSCEVSATLPSAFVHIAADSDAHPAADEVKLLISPPDGNIFATSLGFTYNINWGDQTGTVSPPASSGSGFTISHTYAQPGFYEVGVFATDASLFTSFGRAVMGVFNQQIAGIQPYNIAVAGGAVAGQVAVSADSFGTITYSGKDLVCISDQGEHTTFTVSFGSTLITPIALFGSGVATFYGDDTLVVNGDNSSTNVITKTPGKITWGSPVTETVTLNTLPSAIINVHGTMQNIVNDPGEDTVINGGPGANTISITATTGNGVVINGGPTTNTYIVSLGSLAGPVSIANSNTSASNSLVVNGAPGDNVINAAGSQVTEGTQTITDTAALTNLTINGGSGNNHITVSALTVPIQSLTLDGSAGSADTIAISQSVTAPTTITAGGGTNTLTGGAGTTTFIDHGGTNTIIAGTGVNTLVPGGGTNTFQAPSGATSPIVFADSYNLLANGVLNVAAGGVLINDLSPNANPLTAVLVSGTAHGTLALNANGSFRYTPAANFVGLDTFTYKAKSSTGMLSMVATATIHVNYTFGGFLAPLNSNLAIGLGRTVPIKFQLTGANGAFINSLSSISSLQVLNSQGANVLTNGGSTSLRYDSQANQFVANWQTKGLPAGTYTVMLSLADGTSYKKTIQLSANGSAAALLIDGSTATATVGVLLGGNLELYVDNVNGDLTADELARIQDAVTAVDTVTAPYGVVVVEVTDPTQADVTLNMDTMSAVGGYADGVLGCTTDSGEITIIQGWNWYAGSNQTAIVAGEYDFQTVVTHELGHALGLGHSANAASVMYATLTTGMTNRVLTVADLNVPDSDSGGACGLHAASVGRISNPSYGVDFFEAATGSDPWPTTTGRPGYQEQPSSPTARQAALIAVLADWSSTTDFAGRAGRSLDDGHLLRGVRLPAIDEQDDFWSSIGGTTTPDIIGDLTMELGRNPGRG